MEGAKVTYKFWMVWSPAGPHEPRHKHSTEQGARAEAERLARLHPGSKFYVLKSFDFCQVTDVVWEKTEDIEDVPL